MRPGNHLCLSFLAGLSLALAACTGGGGSGSTLNSIEVALQDLAADPEGMTTVLTFTSGAGLASATAANFEADGGQTALGAVVVGDDVTVTWDARVTPSHQVRAVGLASVSAALVDVTTSDSSAPTFTITDATQNTGLGNDTIEATFAGPHVVLSLAEDPTKWTFVENGQTVPLAGSVFSFDPVTQKLDITLAATAGLHASFTLAAGGVKSVADVNVVGTPVVGAATGDAAAPALVSADQNLAEDEFGRVIDFTFDEAMDPLFSTGLSHFPTATPDVATTVEQPSPEVLRVTFSNPMVPGVNTVTLTGLVDAHGNAFPGGVQAIAQPSPVANAFDGNAQGVTVVNAGGDYILVKTTQAFDPDSAADPARWTLHVAGSPIDLTLQTLDYDLLTKSLTITLDFDMLNGDTFTIFGNGVLDVDGQTFSLGQFQTIAGDTTAPSVVGAVQNRTVDPSGKTIDVQISEDVQAASAETLANWSGNSSQNVVSATLLPSQDSVRLRFDGIVVPGDLTLTASNLADLAGNTMAAPQAGITFTSTDTTPPAATGVTATAVEGANDDTVVAAFNDDIIDSDVETPSTWHVESPVGTTRSTAGATVSYDSAARTATLTFANGVNLHRGDDFKVGFTGVRDIGGNFMTGATVTGNVTFETTLPAVHTAWRDGTILDQLVVRFSEPCDQLTDLYDAVTNPDGTRFVLRDSGGIQRGTATAATVLDSGLGVRLSFGIVIAASDTLDVFGVTDLTGNPMFPKLATAIVAEDPTQPSLSLGLSALASVSGERNDVITVEFDRPMSPWQLLDRSHYSLSGGPGTVDLANAEMTFDGTDTVTIRLDAPVSDYELVTGGGYDLSVDDVRSAQGALRSTADTEFGIVVAGDSTAPGVLVGKVRIDPSTANSLLVEATEALSPWAASVLGNYDLNGGNAPTMAQLVGPRVVRLTFAVTPQAGQDLLFGVNDLAGNSSGWITRAVTAADAAGPLVSSVSGVMTPNWGKDEVRIAFDEPVTGLTALNPANYTVQDGGVTLSLAGAGFTYDGATNQVTIRLAGGVELDASLGIAVTIGGVKDFSGNAMASPIQVGGPLNGDFAAPSFQSAFVNWRANAMGKAIDVLFSEDVDSSFAGDPTRWTASASTVTGVQMLERNHARVTLSAALAAGGTLQLTGLPDLAGNASGAISVNPQE